MARLRLKKPRLRKMKIKTLFLRRESPISGPIIRKIKGMPKHDKNSPKVKLF